MKISIVTITRNNAEGLRQTLQSVYSQSFSDIEHIIVDGNSNDASAAVLAEAAELGSLVVKREPRGVYDAINVGLEHAHGGVIGLLHAGDVLDNENIISTISQAFAGNEHPDFVYGDVRIGKRLYSGQRASRQSLLSGFAPPHPSLFVTAGTMRAAGPYSTEYAISGDYEMFLRLFFNDALSGHYMPLVTTLMAPGGLSAKWRNRLFVNNRERLRALRSHNLPASPLRLLKRYLYL